MNQDKELLQEPKGQGQKGQVLRVGPLFSGRKTVPLGKPGLTTHQPLRVAQATLGDKKPRGSKYQGQKAGEEEVASGLSKREPLPRSFFPRGSLCSCGHLGAAPLTPKGRPHCHTLLSLMRGLSWQMTVKPGCQRARRVRASPVSLQTSRCVVPMDSSPSGRVTGCLQQLLNLTKSSCPLFTLQRCYTFFKNLTLEPWECMCIASFILGVRID